MSDDNNTQQGGGEALPANTQAEPVAKPDTKPAPKNDAEAAIQEKAAAEADAATKAAAEKAEQEKAERRKNRTGEYIQKIKDENADMRRRLQEYERQHPQPARANGAQPPSTVQASPGDAEPTLEDCDFNVSEFQRRHSKWAVAQALKEREESTKQAKTAEEQQKIVDTYQERIAEFADEHPDFHEVVGSIQFVPHPEVQAAIMAHEKGAEIAYFLGTNDDEAFQLASIQPHLAAAAVERLAKRLTAAPTEKQNPPPVSEAPPPNPKPVSSAPPPVPSVSGRSPTNIPPEKMTDDEWAKRERERERKR